MKGRAPEEDKKTISRGNLFPRKPKQHWKYLGSLGGDTDTGQKERRDVIFWALI